MRAVVFDFFGTLTLPAAEEQRRVVYSATGRALGVDGDEFWQQMRSTFADRVTGGLGGTAQTLLAVAGRCGARPTEAQLDRALALHRAGSARVRIPHPAARSVLEHLRQQGVKLGVLTDCSSELVEAWDDTPFAQLVDAAVFSWQEGCRKPDERGYRAAAERLGVRPSSCWFVGDGGSREHWGADRVGMTPVLVRNMRFSVSHLRDDPDPFVPDHAVDDLSDIPALLGRAAREHATWP